MSKGTLTSREKEIIELLTLIDNMPITINDIAKKLKVSSRTILRQMSKIESWLIANDFKLSKKPGVGLMLDASIEEKVRLKSLLDKEMVSKEYSPEERQYFIISELLISKEPIKLYYFTSLLKAAEGTLSSDLDKVQKWLDKFNIKLVRKPGLGIYIEGSEEEYRHAMIHLIYDCMDEGQLLNIIKDNVREGRQTQSTIEISTRNHLLKLIDTETIRTIEELINKIEKEKNLKLADSAYVGLIVHLALAIQRIKNGERIDMDKKALDELKVLPEYKISSVLASYLSKSFDVDISDGEIGYITMHLRGAKLRLNSEDSLYITLDNLELRELAKKIILNASKETGKNLLNSDKLLNDLTNHLGTAINRLNMKLNIRNPLLDKIKEDYSEVFNVSKKSIKPLEELVHEKIPESEIGYIAIHFAAALENYRNNTEKYKVAIACASGIGTSRLLASRIEKEFSNIEVESIISIIHINEEELREKGIDLVISTVSLNINFNNIYVNPLLLEEDKIKIEEALKNFSRKMLDKKHKEVNDHSFIENVKTIKVYSESIEEMIEGFILKENVVAENIDNLIEKTALFFTDSQRQYDDVLEKLLKREELGSTILSDYNIMLLHCRSDEIAKLQVGVLRLKNDIVLKRGAYDEVVNTALVLLAPVHVDNKRLELMSVLSGSLVNDDNFINVIKQGSHNDIINKISKLLANYYYSKIKIFLDEN